MKKLFLTAILLAGLMPLFAAFNTWGIPDSSEIRTQLVEKWFEASLESVRQNVPEIYANAAGEKFQVRLEETDTTFNVYVAPRNTINVKVYSADGVTNEKQDVYPGDAPGSWVLIRDKKTEKPLKIRYYFIADNDVFVQFTPYGKTALADIAIYGNYAAKGASTGVSFTTFYTTSFQNVLDMTKRVLPWNYVTIDSEAYHSILQDAAVIQKNLPRIMYAPDAMYDEDNRLVRVTTGKPYDVENLEEGKLYLSSAGFLKWIADGLVKPVSGGMLKRQPLLTETVKIKDDGYQGVLSQKYGLFQALDWIRNLSAAVMSVYTGRNYLFGESGTDVTINPFAATISNQGTVNTVTFIEDSGYNVKVLKSLLYVLAATDPGTFYFGAIRETDRTVSPEIKVFNQNVVFLPYFDSNDLFGCYVFMDGRSYNIDDFCLNHTDDFVYLTRVRSSEAFFPE